jgi:predicted GNAT superfamily acetyltransferase
MPPEITITEQPIADAIHGELWPLAQAHHAELAVSQAAMRLAPDAQRYRAVEAAGGLLALVMRAGGQAVGYSINFLSNPIHHAETLLVINDAFFVDASHRAELGLRLMRATRDAARQRGAARLWWTAKPHTAMDAILRTRCAVEETVFTEDLQ